MRRRDRMLLDLDEEIQGYIEHETLNNIERGMLPEEARRAARIKFGNVARVKEQAWEVWNIIWFEQLIQDICFGSRMLRKNLGFTLVAILTLSLGIGINTAIFSLTNQLLLQNLPVADPGHLAILRVPGDRLGHVSSDSEDATTFSYPMYRDLREEASVFSGLLARFGMQVSVQTDGESQLAKGELVSGNYFDVLGIKPSFGRIFTPDDEGAPNANPIAILGYGYWKSRFGGNPGVLNKPLNVNGTLLTVVGIAPPGFDGVQIGRSTDIFVPINMKALMTPGWDGLAARNDSWLSILGRLRPGITRDRASVELAPIFRAIEETDLSELGVPQQSQRARQYLSRPIELTDGAHGRPILQTRVQTPLFVLFALVGLILLIACANLAGLLLARGEARQREMAVRVALGAGRWRLVQQLLTESSLLALFGAIFGMFLASITVRGLAIQLTRQLAVSGLDLHIDVRSLGFTMAVSIVTILLFGLGPALRLTNSTLPDRLKSVSVSTSAGVSDAELRRWMMVAQVALTAVLLGAAAYFVRSLANLDHQDLGVRVDHVVQFSIRPALSHYSPQQTAELFDRIRHEVASLPGVHSVSVAKYPSFEQDDWASNVTVEGLATQPDADMEVFHNSVGPDYFAALGIPLIVGRDVLESDSSAGPKVAVINEKMAQRFFAGRNPLGFHFAWGNNAPDIEVVGVVRNSKYEDLRDSIHPFAYVPYAQDPTIGTGTFYVLTGQDPTSSEGALRMAVQRVDSSLPVFGVMTLQEEADRSVFLDRALTFFSICLGLLAASLAAVGVYGVLAYSVASRTKEIGIRIAIGATRSQVLQLILGELILIAGSGIAGGLIGAFALGLLVESHLYGVRAGDPVVLLFIGALLVAIIGIAGYVPARRATKVDPMVALRYE